MLSTHMERILPEQVRAQVQRFWNILSGKSKANLHELYSADAIVFTGRAKRSEPAALATARRTRQFTASSASLAAELGEIDVQIVEDVAIASYIYQFHEVRKKGDGSHLNKKTRFGRATQIFQLDPAHGLQIVHEHLSAGEAPEVSFRA